MTTWQLWRHIIRPPQDSPIYQWVQRQPGPPIPWYVGCAEIFAFLLIVPMVVLIGPVYGFAWVIGISQSIARARENGALALMSLTPAGPLGASFALATASMHREGALARISQRATWSGRLAVILLMYATILAPRTAAGEPILGMLATLLVVTAALYPDHVQSISLACVAGMLAADFSASRTHAQWLAFLLLSTLQAGVYGAALTLYVLLTGDGLQMAVAALAAVMTLFITREALFLLLWRALANRFGTATVLDLVPGGGV